MKDFQELFAELVASVIGWLICMVMLGGAFGLGMGLAKWSGAIDLAPVSGLLSAIAVIWLYEHRLAHARWEKLNERLDHLWAKVNGLD